MSKDRRDLLRRYLEVIHEKFKELYCVEAGERFAMEIEFKITSEDILAIKQARPWVFIGAQAAGCADEDSNRPATGAPVITGAAQVGETLTAGVSGIEDADGMDNAAFSYQWLAGDEPVGGSTEASYTLVEEDSGKTITVSVSFTDDAGSEGVVAKRPHGGGVGDRSRSAAAGQRIPPRYGLPGRALGGPWFGRRFAGNRVPGAVAAGIGELGRNCRGVRGDGGRHLAHHHRPGVWRRIRRADNRGERGWRGSPLGPTDRPAGRAGGTPTGPAEPDGQPGSQLGHADLGPARRRFGHWLPDTAAPSPAGRAGTAGARGEHRQHGRELHRYRRPGLGLPPRVPGAGDQLRRAGRRVELRPGRADGIGDKEPPPSPLGLTAAVAGQEEVALSWDVLSGASQYLIEFRNGDRGEWLIAGSSVGITKWTVTGLTCGIEYEFRASSYSGGGTTYTVGGVGSAFGRRVRDNRRV